jgi:hypothetical protein
VGDISGVINITHLTTAIVPSIVGPIAGAIFGQLSQRELLSHSLKQISECFDSTSGEPYLQRKVESWPDTAQYLSFFKSLSNLPHFLSYYVDKTLSNMKKANLACEQQLDITPGYRVTDFVVPSLRLQEKALSNFTVQMEIKFEEFYEGAAFRDRLITTVSESAELPA